MYDASTESLWQQILGEAVVGDKTGTKLSVYPSQVISFNELEKRYPNAQVLSIDTSHLRDYGSSPYGDYATNDALYFPVSISDTRLPAKEVMYVVNFNEKSVAFKLKDLSATPARVSVDADELTARIVDGEVAVTSKDGGSIPGYHTMWFAWAVYHQKDGIVWKGKTQL